MILFADSEGHDPAARIWAFALRIFPKICFCMRGLFVITDTKCSQQVFVKSSRGKFLKAIYLFVLCLTLCYFVLVFFSLFSIAITSLGELRAILSAIHTYVRFTLVWICQFPLLLGVWEGLRFLIVTLPGLFSYFFFVYSGMYLICNIKNT